MNIAIISYYFNDHHAEGIVTAKLARALAEVGHSISVFSNLVGDQEIVKKVDSRFINKNKRTFIPIWGRSIKIRPVSEALGKIISDKDTR